MSLEWIRDMFGYGVCRIQLDLATINNEGFGLEDFGRTSDDDDEDDEDDE